MCLWADIYVLGRTFLKEEGRFYTQRQGFPRKMARM